MNYRHHFHAGNLGDVLKHLVLAAVIERLKAKDAPITVIDTHAGAGLYELDSQGGEWQGGIGRLIPSEAAGWPPLLAPYAAALGGEPLLYPGSPLVALRLLREQDRLIACETVEEVAAELRRHLAHDPRAAVHRRDGWAALRAFLPVKTGRTMVLIDPPFEAGEDFELLSRHIAEAAKRAPTAIVIGWFPVKGRRAVEALYRRLAGSGLEKLLAVEFLAEPDHDAGRFAGSGLVILRPPFQLDQALRETLPVLLDRMGYRATGSTRVEWLAGEAARGIDQDLAG
ncbi:23S rRNA (adenine(2030)-N(6))-methyltransferase RlmJ [Zavarzinia compransoris]|uniref:Ribosomal RNA large subunit methyltransferase J n=1 Tax=Zavarzinia compransoris TaxID=1264899 RepID=A0A317E5L5_9PROT|nr:23S rRNA (adenine(2030)-N(6))-methyltransferase RlmJ [Zavarzinia compransoris]PWR20633.1 23S rRNA (adenine(2030)-N(6))-methyltransferase RlmJ [Zavarzinia compransoris]TDP44550.1 23S rRNA (adenine2030-N6)-methyltransferase [Zavarzinia compransoris]